MKQSRLTWCLRLVLATVFTVPAAVADAQQFRRPTACSGCIANWYYFDNDPDDGVAEDWDCGTSTYDDHNGSDFSLAGNIGAIDAGHDVVAMADGVVERAEDGHFDRCTECGGSGCGTGFGFGYGNHVVINHGTRKTAYAHMRMGSIRVSVGDTVTCGQTIGQIASSGCSTGAHLHVETRPLGGSAATAYDPFDGACSPGPSAWVDQGTYRGLPGGSCSGSTAPTCPSGTFEIWTCDSGRTSRRRCIDGTDETDACPYGCISMPVGTDDVCEAAPDADSDGYPADLDCDDTDGSRHPGASDDCGDGVDQDCDGSDATCAEDGGTDAVVGADTGTTTPPEDGSFPDTPRRPGGAGVSAGCGCATTAAESPVPTAFLTLVLLAAIGRRRAASRRSGSSSGPGT